MSYISTYTGTLFYPLSPIVEDIHIEDIAHALGMICRFNGHVSIFYSVAEHSVHVSRIVPKGYELAALLHDASEAYISDLSRPMKRAPGFSMYSEFERNLMDAVWERFSPTRPYDCPEVKRADNIMLGVEARALMPVAEWVDDLPTLNNYKLELWSPQEAKINFLSRFMELTSG